MRKRLLATMLALCMILTLLPVTALATDVPETNTDSESDGNKYVEGFEEENAEDCPYAVEVIIGFQDKKKTFYFKTFSDAASAAENGFYIKWIDGEQEKRDYYCSDTSLSNESDPFATMLFEQGKPYSVIIDAEEPDYSKTISENITISSEVHFKLASRTWTGGRVPDPQQISFTGQITIESGGKLIQERGGTTSSANVTLSHPIQIKSGGSLKLVQVGGSTEAPKTT